MTRFSKLQSKIPSATCICIKASWIQGLGVSITGWACGGLWTQRRMKTDPWGTGSTRDRGNLRHVPRLQNLTTSLWLAWWIPLDTVLTKQKLLSLNFPSTGDSVGNWVGNWKTLMDSGSCLGEKWGLCLRKYQHKRLAEIWKLSWLNYQGTFSKLPIFPPISIKGIYSPVPREAGFHSRKSKGKQGTRDLQNRKAWQRESPYQLLPQM